MIIRESTSADMDAANRVRRLAFGPFVDTADVGDWRGFVAELDGRVCGFLRVFDYRQFFGGSAVPMGGVASVAVDPYARGRGVATALLNAATRSMYEHGQCLSALFAATPRVYRSRGWEATGVVEWLDVAFDRLLAVPRPRREVKLRPAVPDDLPAMHASYLSVASTVDGLLARSPYGISDVFSAGVTDLAVGAGGAVLGYLTASRRQNETLTVHDLVAGDGDTARTLLRSIGTWSGQLQRASVRILDPALTQLLVPLPARSAVSSYPWMLRVLDLPAAVAARGWPAAAALRPCTVDMEIVDEQVPWQAGRHRLVVEGDRMRVEAGGTGAVRLQARALGPWYAGAATSAGLRRAGLLDGDPEQAALLDLCTAGGDRPRMADQF